jgi:hypothetical protein
MEGETSDAMKAVASRENGNLMAVFSEKEMRSLSHHSGQLA